MSEIFDMADALVEDVCSLDPMLRIFLAIPGEFDLEQFRSVVPQDRAMCLDLPREVVRERLPG